MSTAATSTHTVEGMVVPFNRWQEVNNSREGHFLERFAVGSLSKSFGLLRRVKGYFDYGRTASFDRMPVFSVEEAWEEPTGAYFRGSLLDGIPTFVIDGIRKGLYGASLGAEPIDVDVDPFPTRGTQRRGSWLWRLRALWNGTVVVDFVTPRPSDADRKPPPIDWIVTKAWRAAAHPLEALTGIPDREHVRTHLALQITSGPHQPHGR
jgi:hypothetical protein